MGLENFKTFREVTAMTMQDRRKRDIKTNCIYGIDILDDYLGGILENELVVIGAGSGVGKAQRLTDLVLTPTGWDIMGNIVPGSHVIGADGKSKLVCGIPYQGIQKVFKLTMDDGRTCYAGEHHEFRVFYKGNKNKTKNIYSDIEVCDLIKGMANNKRYSIDFVKPIEYTTHNLSIDPYSLGAIIGNGCSAKGSLKISSNDEEIINRIKIGLDENEILRKINVSDPKQCSSYQFVKKVKSTVGLANVVNQYKRLGLEGKKAKDKFIPSHYLISSLTQRTSLLQGLMDTDGYVVRYGKDNKLTRLGYTTMSKQLANDIYELILSLGGRANLNSYAATLNKIYMGEKYCVTFSLPEEITPFLLKRKADSYVLGKARLYHSIKTIEYIGEFETKCLSVEDSLYITQDYIVTHNTEIACKIASANAMRGKKVALFSLEGDIGEISYRYLQTQINKSLGKDFIKGPEFRLNLKNVNYLEDIAYDNIPQEMDNIYLFDKSFIPDRDRLLKLIADVRDDVDMFIIDHLHYLDYGNDEYAGISSVIKAIKELTEIMKKPVVVISHLSRKAGQEKRIPNKSDLHGSSNIEKNANTVILLTPGDLIPYVDINDASSYLRGTKIVVDKNRTGMPVPAIFDITFDLRTKEYVQLEGYSMISQDEANKITEFDKISFRSNKK